MNTSPQPTRVRYVVMAFLCSLSFLTYFDRFCIVRAQSEIQRELEISDAEMGLVLGAFWLAYALFEIPGGWLGDRLGARITLLRIVLAWSLFTFLSGTAWGFFSLLVFRFLFGVGEAGAYPNMARVQSNWLPARSRARAGGLLWLLARWGGAFAPLIVDGMLAAFDHPSFRTWLADSPFSAFAGITSWRLSFWASGLLGVVWCALFYPWFRDDPAEKRSVNAAELALIRGEGGAKRVNEKHSMPARAWRALFRSPSLWAMGILYIAGSFGWSFFASWLPKFLAQVHGLNYNDPAAVTEMIERLSETTQLPLASALGWMPPRSLLAVITGLPLFLGGISCLVGGALSDWLVRRTGRKWLMRAIFPMCGYGIAALAMLLVRVAPQPEHAVLLMCVAGAAVDFGQGANWASIVDLGGRYAGTATGFINMVGNAGNYLQPVIGALIFNHLGWGALFAVYATMYLVAAGMWLLIDPSQPFYEEE